jgi:hypothetical protein
MELSCWWNPCNPGYDPFTQHYSTRLKGSILHVVLDINQLKRCILSYRLTDARLDRTDDRTTAGNLNVK